MKLSLSKVLLLAGISSLSLVAGAAGTCNIDNNYVVAQSASGQTVNTQLCQAIWWNTYQGCLETGRSASFCVAAYAQIATISPSSTWSFCNAHPDPTNPDPVGCAVDLTYFTGVAGSATINNTYTVNSMNCPSVVAASIPTEPQSSPPNIVCS